MNLWRSRAGIPARRCRGCTLPQPARREGSADLELRTLLDAAEVALYHNQIQDLLTLSLRAVDLTSMVDDPRGEALANFYASISHTIRGEPGPAAQFGDAGIAAAQRLRHHFYLARTLSVREYVARLLGQWPTALELCNRGLAVSPRESRLLFGRVLGHVRLVSLIRRKPVWTS